MRLSTRRLLITCGSAALFGAGCGGEPLITEPLGPDPVPDLGSQTVTLAAGETAAEYMAVLVNTAVSGTTSASYSIRATGVAPSATRAADAAAALGLPEGNESGPARDDGFEARLRDRERVELSPRIAGAQAWRADQRSASGSTGLAPAASRRNAIPATARVGDIVRVNVQSDSACGAPIYHGARIAAIGTRAMILQDTLNPRNGFTDADYRRYAARFDTLVYPLDSAAFGAPTDIDGNGHVAIIFTRAVNEQTPRNATAYVGGFTFSRDLFPIAGSARTQPCAGSNEGELFYLLAPDPLGTINGNARTTGFVDSTTTSIIAHEFVHLIGAGRRLYVTTAPAFEVKWLDEGLAHIAEELLFYRETGLTPRANIDIGILRASTRTVNAYNRDMSGNQGRYRSYLLAPARSSPFATNDDLSTRGATWSLLRYLADRSGTGDGTLFSRLIDGRVTGIENLVGVFGSGLGAALRDWNVSHAVDDLVSTPVFQQPSWNWHSIYPSLGVGASYPLASQPMTSGASYAGTILSGGAAYFRITVPANTTASVSLSEQSAAPSTLSLVTVRTR